MDAAILEFWRNSTETQEGSSSPESGRSIRVPEKHYVSEKPLTPDLFDALFPSKGRGGLS